MILNAKWIRWKNEISFDVEHKIAFFSDWFSIILKFGLFSIEQVNESNGASSNSIMSYLVAEKLPKVLREI
jgi:hypothetical protein